MRSTILPGDFKKFINAAVVFLAFCVHADITTGVWWWSGADAAGHAAAAKRLDFLAERGVGEIYFAPI